MTLCHCFLRAACLPFQHICLFPGPNDYPVNTSYDVSNPGMVSGRTGEPKDDHQKEAGWSTPSIRKNEGQVRGTLREARRIIKEKRKNHLLRIRNKNKIRKGRKIVPMSIGLRMRSLKRIVL